MGLVSARVRTVGERVFSRGRLEEMITEFNLHPELRGPDLMEEIVGHVRKGIRVALSAGIPGQHWGAW
jgi:hypothetical protein